MQPTLPNKFCKDCKHLRVNTRESGLIYGCARHGISDLVTGEEDVIDPYEERHRVGDEVCGEVGRYWEALVTKCSCK